LIVQLAPAASTEVQLVPVTVKSAGAGGGVGGVTVTGGVIVRPVICAPEVFVTVNVLVAVVPPWGSLQNPRRFTLAQEKVFADGRGSGNARPVVVWPER
jgi:hypothetical protein